MDSNARPLGYKKCVEVGVPLSCIRNCFAVECRKNYFDHETEAVLGVKEA